MDIVNPEEKNGKKEQMLIDDNKKTEDASDENSLMKKVKVKNEFEGGQKNRKR